jgi:DNA mismatch endonuclease, patch repair protein
MSRTGRRDTKPELELRRHLHALGLRFRVDRPVLADKRRRVDIVFGPAKVAVFVDGCFWHGCAVHATSPKQNAEYWREKIETNRARDRDTNDQLARAGWHVVRVWEHEDMTSVAADVAEVVGERRRALRPNDERGRA